MVVVEAVHDRRVAFVVVERRGAVEEVLDLVLGVEPAFDAGVNQDQQNGVHDGDVQEHPLAVEQFPVRNQGVQLFIRQFGEEEKYDRKQNEYNSDLCHGHEPGVFPLEREALVEFDVLSQHRQSGGDEDQNVFQHFVCLSRFHWFLLMYQWFRKTCSYSSCTFAV